MKNTKCIYPGCRKSAIRRGLCVADYNRYGQRVFRGVVTWLELVDSGLATEQVSKRGRKKKK